MIPKNESINQYLQFDNLTIEYNEKVYKPREDTLLILDLLKSIIKKPSFCFEVGIGTGILSIYIADVYPISTIIGIDLNIEACRISLVNKIRNNIDNFLIICGDGLRSFRKNIEYDFVISNPPYLPANHEYDQYLEKNDLIQFVGGEDGIEFTESLLRDVIRISKTFYVIISSETITLTQFKEKHPTLTIKEIGVIRLDFEILWFVKIKVS